MPKRKSLQPIAVETVKRSTIKPHPRNPRTMTKEARQRLSRGLNKFGMLEPFVVNRRTSHVLGGHQRLLWMDEKHKDTDYDVQVSWCDVAESDEVNVLTLLNQPNAQGEWDTDLLNDLLLSQSLDVELAGFEQLDLELLLPDTDWSTLFSDSPAAVEKTRQEMDKVAEVNKSQRKQERESVNTQHDTEHYAIVVFGTREEKAAFLKRLGLPGDERYVSATAIEPHLPATPPKRKARQQEGRSRKSAKPKDSGACG